MRRIRIGCALALSAVLTLAAAGAYAQVPDQREAAVATGTDETVTPRTAVLPVVPVGKVRSRYVKRLQAALDGAGGPAEATVELPENFELMKVESGPCAEDPACVKLQGKALNATRLLSPTLATGEDDGFLVNMRLLDVDSGELLIDDPQPVAHSALTRFAAGALSGALDLARAPLDELLARRDAAEKARQAEADKGLVDARELLVAQAALTAAATGRKPPSRAIAADDPRLLKMLAKLDPKLEVVSPEQLADEAVERRKNLSASPGGAHNGRPAKTSSGGPGGGGTDKADDSWSALQKLGGERAKLKKGEGGGAWAARRDAFAQRPDSGNLPDLNILGAALAALPWLLGLALGFSVVHFMPRLPARRRKFGVFSTSGNSTHAAVAQRLVAQCSKKRSAGIAASAECGLTMPFRFALCQGGTVAIDLELPKQHGFAACRRGSVLVAQFAHEGEAYLCVMEVVRANRPSSKVVRVVLQAPTHVAPVALPQAFRIPLATRQDVGVQVHRGSEAEGDPLAAAATHAAGSELELELDDDTAVEAGAQLHINLRVGARTAEVLGTVQAANGNGLSVRVESDPEGGEPEAYAKLMQQLRLDWVSRSSAA